MLCQRVQMKEVGPIMSKTVAKQRKAERRDAAPPASYLVYAAASVILWQYAGAWHGLWSGVTDKCANGYPNRPARRRLSCIGVSRPVQRGAANF